MRKYLITLLLFFSTTAFATDTFNGATNILNIDSIVVGGTQYNNVVVHLTGYNVVSVGSSAPVTSTSTACSNANFNASIYNAISVGMTISQVNQTIGCNFDSTKSVTVGSLVTHTWIYTDTTNIAVEMISVYFDSASGVVTSTMGTFFKTSYGF